MRSDKDTIRNTFAHLMGGENLFVSNAWSEAARQASAEARKNGASGSMESRIDYGKHVAKSGGLEWLGHNRVSIGYAKEHYGTDAANIHEIAAHDPKASAEWIAKNFHTGNGKASIHETGEGHHVADIRDTQGGTHAFVIRKSEK